LNYPIITDSSKRGYENDRDYNINRYEKIESFTDWSSEKTMLIRITEYQKVDNRKLMDVYSESNYENTDYFYPDEKDKNVAVQRVEEGFLDYLKNDFFNKTDATYWILEIDDAWVSALRTCRIQEGLYYLEALETRPDQRRKGYGVKLLSSVADSLKEDGPFRLCSCVSKKNIASLMTHKKSGFQIVSEEGYDYLNKEADDHDFGLEYRYHGT
jgi:L-amino acid N-acyltransferase YncA